MDKQWISPLNPDWPSCPGVACGSIPIRMCISLIEEQRCRSPRRWPARCAWSSCHRRSRYNVGFLQRTTAPWSPAGFYHNTVRFRVFRLSSIFRVVDRWHRSSIAGGFFMGCQPTPNVSSSQPSPIVPDGVTELPSLWKVQSQSLLNYQSNQIYYHMKLHVTPRTESIKSNNMK